MLDDEAVEELPKPDAPIVVAFVVELVYKVLAEGET